MIGEPGDFLACPLVDEGGWKAPPFLCIKDLFHDIFLTTARSDEGDVHSVRNNGQCECDALWWRLRGVANRGHP